MVHQLRTSPTNSLASWAKNNGRYFFLLKNSDHVITCTPDLDALAQNYNSCTIDISSTINTLTYLPVNRYTNHQELIIGWSGSHSTVPYLHLLDDVFAELSSLYQFKLLVMGCDFFHMPGVNVEFLPWSDDVEIITTTNGYWCTLFLTMIGLKVKVALRRCNTWHWDYPL